MAPEGRLDQAAIAGLEEAFGQEHERTYGHRAGPEEPVELTEIRIIGQGIPDRPMVPRAVQSVAYEGPPLASRRAYFGPDAGWFDTPVLHRADLESPRDGPCIIEEYDATCVVAPGARAVLDAFGNAVIELPA